MEPSGAMLGAFFAQVDQGLHWLHEAEEGTGSSDMDASTTSSASPPLALFEDVGGVSSTSSIPVFTAGSSHPQHHPLTAAKHICAICGDRASGKHYGVFSCEGCKGFFKRTVRKDLSYNCRENRSCIIDKRQRNRCQYCRYRKCQDMGMKREAVQEERQRMRLEGSGDGVQVPESTSSGPDLPPGALLAAELAAESVSGPDDARLIVWARAVPGFVDLPLDDQVSLIRGGWKELVICWGAAGRSWDVPEPLRERVAAQLGRKLREMGLDQTELACLRAIVLLNPDIPGLSSPARVETLREKVYITLQDYCRQRCPDEAGRFAKLLLRLPPLRSIGLHSEEPLLPSPPPPHTLRNALSPQHQLPNHHHHHTYHTSL